MITSTNFNPTDDDANYDENDAVWKEEEENEMAGFNVDENEEEKKEEEGPDKENSGEEGEDESEEDEEDEDDDDDDDEEGFGKEEDN